jgi:hypothetical protein
MPEQYEIRWFKESDLGSYIEGLNKTLYYDYSERLFRWKFERNPFSLGFPSIAVAEHILSGESVAFNSFLPMEVREGDDVFTVLQGCDGFVDEAHRRQGLFQMTLNFMADEMSGLSPEILIGFNLVEAAAAAQKAGSAFAHDIDRCFMGRKAFAGFRDRRGVAVEPISVEALSGLYEEWAAGSGLLHIHRALPYIRWYNENPLRRVQMYMVHRGGSPEGYLVVDEITEGGELELTIEDYPPGLLDGGLLRGVLSCLHEANPGVDVVNIYTLRGEPLENDLAGLEFTAAPWFKVIMKALNNAVQERGSVIRNGKELSDLRRWHITAGDIY